ncbi:MAG: hypothetical protein ACOYU7_10915, partial [Bacillota bacterium]
MRKALTLFLALVVLLTAVFPAWAAPVSSVTTFGYTQARNREGLVVGGLPIPVWFHDTGRSFSQGLLFSGKPWGYTPEAGEPDVALAVSAEGKMLYGFKFPSGTLKPGLKAVSHPHLWAQSLSATTKSDPTLVNWNGKQLMFVGTASPYLDVFDATDFSNTQWLRSVKAKATDIVSAPTAFNWRGHLAVVYTCGNTGNVAVTFDPLDPQKAL